MIHFRELLEKRKGLSWLDYATFARRTRIKRRGKIAKKYLTCGARVLELGSGLGELTRELVETRAQITGLEIHLQSSSLLKIESVGVSLCYQSRLDMERTDQLTYPVSSWL